MGNPAFVGSVLRIDSRDNGGGVWRLPAFLSPSLGSSPSLWLESIATQHAPTPTLCWSAISTNAPRCRTAVSMLTQLIWCLFGASSARKCFFALIFETWGPYTPGPRGRHANKRHKYANDSQMNFSIHTRSDTNMRLKFLHRMKFGVFVWCRR